MAASNARTERPKKQKKQQLIMTVCRILLIVLGGGYIAAHLFGGIFGGFSGRMTTVAATVASSYEYALHDAYIFRDENVITSVNSGYRYDLLGDGEMAGIGTECARVYTSAQSEETDKKLSALDRSIELFEKCAVDLNAGGFLNAQSTLSDGHMSIAHALSSGDVIGALEYVPAIAEAYETLRINTGSSATVAENLALVMSVLGELRAQRDALVASFGTEYESIKATRTGYYYSGVDGYETTMSSANIENRSLSELFAAIDSLSGDGVMADGTMGRMVYDYHWYAAVPMDMAEAVNYIDVDGNPARSKFTVGFYDGEWSEIEMTLERVVQSPDDSRAILLFSSGTMSVGFDGGRVRRVRIVTNEVKGYRVPAKAVTLGADGAMGVYVLKGGQVVFKPVEIVDDSEKDAYYLARIIPAEEDELGRALAQNDAIIVSGQDLYDGKTVYY